MENKDDDLGTIAVVLVNQEIVRSNNATERVSMGEMAEDAEDEGNEKDGEDEEDEEDEWEGFDE